MAAIRRGLPAMPVGPRRRTWRALVVGLAVSALLCLGWADSWDAIRAAAANVHAIRADFVQEKHLPMLAHPLISHGKLYYQRPDSLRWEYTEPVRSVLLMHAGEARRFVAVDGKLVPDAGMRLEAMQFVMPEISGWLGGRFQDNAMFAATLEAGNRIQLVPRDAGMAKVIQRIELTLADQPGVIKTVRIFESEDAYTTMTFVNTTVNPQLDPRIFSEVE